MPFSTGYAPSKKPEQTAGDYLTSSKPSYGYGSSSSGYPSPTPAVSGAPNPYTVGSDAYKYIQATDPSQFLPKDIYGQYQNLVQEESAWASAHGGNKDMGKGDKVLSNPYDAQISSLLSKYAPAGYGNLAQALIDGKVAIDQNTGQFYDPNAPTGFEKAMEIGTALLALYAFAPFLGAAGASGGGATAGTEGVAAVTPESLAYNVGQLTASNVAPGVADTLVEGAGTLGSGTLADITVTAAGAAGAGTFAGLAGGGALALDALGTAPDLSGVSMSKPNYPLSSYTPKA
jgi:hypothetical protein